MFECGLISLQPGICWMSCFRNSIDPRKHGVGKMKYAFLALSVLVSATALIPTEASAFVCAAGVYRAGCVGPHGAVAVRRPAVVAPVRCAFVNGVRVCR
jgi:hypothetical protein